VTSQATTVGASRALTFAYSTTGNLTGKTSNVAGDLNVTGYAYTGPHRLTSVSIGGISNTLSYDQNGNIIQYAAASGPNTWIDYDERNNVTQIHVGPNESAIVARDQFWYDTDDQRVQSLESWDESGTTRTRRVLYLGGDVEEVRAPATATHDRIVRLQVTAAVRAIARRRASDQVWEAWYFEYAHRDHLGSVDVITNSAGVVQQKTSFDPYGGRRSTTWNADLPTAGLAALRDWQDSRGSRGFTDHEHLNRTGFVHMNGRVYDPRIGRFVSPDPIVQAPWFSQSYNRYAYVFGSPLSYTDPSGYEPKVTFEGGKGKDINLNGFWVEMFDWGMAFPDVPVAGGIGVVTFPVVPIDIPQDVSSPPIDTRLPPPTVVIVVPEYSRAEIDYSATTCDRPGCLGDYAILQEWVFGGVSKDDLRSAQSGPLLVMGAAVAAPYVPAAASIAGGIIVGVWARVPAGAKEAIWELGGELLSGYAGQPSFAGNPNPDVDAPPQGVRREQVDKPHHTHRLPKGLRLRSP
jgi:RHS repeat-associated protein